MTPYSIIAILWAASLGLTNWYTATRYEAIGIALEKQHTAELINTARIASDRLVTDERAAAARTGAGFEARRRTVRQTFDQLDNEARYEATTQQHTAPASVDTGACELPASRLRRWNAANAGAYSAAPAPTPSEPASTPASPAIINERRNLGGGSQPQASSQALPRTGGTGLRAAGLPSQPVPSPTFRYGSHPNDDK